MNKFDKARFQIDLVEAASKAVTDAAWNRIRYDSTYFDYEGDTSKWYDDAWLETHVNETGREYLKMAEELTKKIDNLV